MCTQYNICNINPIETLLMIVVQVNLVNVVIVLNVLTIFEVILNQLFINSNNNII